MRTLKRFWTTASGEVTYCTTDNSTTSCIVNDSSVEIKTTKQNLYNAICTVLEDFAECNSPKNYTKSELLEIADNYKLLFENKEK